MEDKTVEFQAILEEELAARKLVDEEYDLAFAECRSILENVGGPFELLSLAFNLGYSRAVKAGAYHG